jgi:hypothetical protein
MSKVYVVVGLDVPEQLDLDAKSLVSDLLRHALAERGLGDVVVGGILALSPDDIDLLHYYSRRGVGLDHEDWHRIWAKMDELSQAIDLAAFARKKEAP